MLLPATYCADTNVDGTLGSVKVRYWHRATTHLSEVGALENISKVSM